MRLGLGRLRLAPEVFWRMTLPELRAAAGGLVPVPAILRRAELDALICQYPDDEDDEDGEEGGSR